MDNDIDMTNPEELTPLVDDMSSVLTQYRQIANAAIEEAENWLRQGALSRAIPDAIPDAIVITDEVGIIVAVNVQFELMFGYHRSEAIGSSVDMLLPETSRAPCRTTPLL
jgi:PAS domain-containing protein